MKLDVLITIKQLHAYFFFIEINSILPISSSKTDLEAVSSSISSLVQCLIFFLLVFIFTEFKNLSVGSSFVSLDHLVQKAIRVFSEHILGYGVTYANIELNIETQHNDGKLKIFRQ